ncbi:MAG: hypothetical protein ACREUQ_07375 [Burkholderiales bacterium]
MAAGLYLNPATYGDMVQRGQENNYLLSMAPNGDLLLRVKVADKQAALIRYQRRTVIGRDAFVPVGVMTIPWNTSGDLRAAIGGVLYFAKIASFLLMGPAVIALVEGIIALQVTIELLTPFKSVAIKTLAHYWD